MSIDDTIVAISSPPGAAVRGIVRLSGPEARPIAGAVFRPECEIERPCGVAARYIAGEIVLAAGLVPASAYVFAAPRSYTGQDVVELHLLGAPVVLGLLVERLIACGARRAEAGEFTARAFLAGKLDLSQVHGVAGMIAARSDEQLRAAERLLHGTLARTALAAREELADLLSLVEGAMDFADEPIEFIPPAELASRLRRVHAALAATLAAGLRVERWGELPRVLLVGRPNAGKSSLLNRLTGMDRAICTSIAGTTRDVLSAPLRLGETECLLVDAAGVDHPKSAVERQAQAALEHVQRTADVILYVIDLAEADRSFPALPRRAGLSSIIVANKCDLVDDAARCLARERLSRAHGVPVVLTSALTGEGCEALKETIELVLRDRPADINDAAIALVAEHRQALRIAVEALGRAMRLSDRRGEGLEDADLVAAELRAAAAALGVLVGQENTEELLGRIFSRFCIGK